MINVIHDAKSPILSILICTLPDRIVELRRLVDCLTAQIKNELSDSIEILTEDTPRGNETTGKKRDLLLKASSGKYISFVDDDDMVSHDYIQRVIEASKQEVDCIGMCGLHKRNNTHDWMFRHSITVSRWCSDPRRAIYYRTPNHLNPVKREHAIATGFKNITYAEDKDYSDRIKPLLKTEVFLERPIYFYLDY